VLTDPSVLFDGAVVPGGDNAVEGLSADPDVLRFLAEAFRHGKTVGAVGAGIELLVAAGLDAVEFAAEAAEPMDSHGVVMTRASGDVTAFVEALAAALALHRSWDRPAPRHPG
jgi:catalase